MIYDLAEMPNGGGQSAPRRATFGLLFFFVDRNNKLTYNTDMLKLTSKHQNYEVWSEWASESIFMDHKPTKAEIDYLWKKWWHHTKDRPKVFKLKPFYTANELSLTELLKKLKAPTSRHEN